MVFTFGGGHADEKHDQKATVNNSFCSKTKPAGPLGTKVEADSPFSVSQHPVLHHLRAPADFEINSNVLE